MWDSYCGESGEYLSSPSCVLTCKTWGGERPAWAQVNMKDLWKNVFHLATRIPPSILDHMIDVRFRDGDLQRPPRH